MHAVETTLSVTRVDAWAVNSAHCQAHYQIVAEAALAERSIFTPRALELIQQAEADGGHVGFVGVSHDVQLPGIELFFSTVHLHGGPAPVRRFLPELIQLIWDREINPGAVFDLTLPLEDAAEGYRAMDQRRAIKVLLQP